MPEKKPAIKKTTANKKPRTQKNASEHLTLVSLSEAICQSASRAESTYWQTHLETRITALLDTGSNQTVMDALDFADAKSADNVADTLAEAAETVAQTVFFMLPDDDGHVTDYQAMLFSIPLIAWSKYQIPTGKIALDSVAKINKSLAQHLIASDVQFGICPHLYVIDTLPQGFTEARSLVKEMADAITNNEQYYPSEIAADDAVLLPADARFVLGVAMAKLGQPIFQWQTISETSVDKAKYQAFANWLAVARDYFVKLLPGCEFEMGMPNAFFHNCRQADIRIRPHSVNAVIKGTAELLELPVKNLTIVIAPVGETEVDEYRIGLMHKDDEDVINGAIWPLFASEGADIAPYPIDVIEALVREAKVGEVIILEGLHQPEYCEDCGAPFFFNRDGEALHPFMPEALSHDAPKFH